MKKSNKPLVSIIIPVYNGANYMKEAIDSALNQTYENIEIIVVNDGSTDETESIALSYGNKIRYYSKENGGVSTALNLGISKMKGTFFSWLSHDDRYYEDKIEKQISYLEKHHLIDEKVILYSNYDVINENSKVTNVMHFEEYEPNKYPEYALLHGLVSGTALLIPKEAFKAFGLFDTKYRCIQDYLLFFKFMKKYRYVFISDVTNSTRIHSKQVTNNSPKIQKENNYLWIYMQKNLDDNIKIRLSGSKYLFYKEMYYYLKNNNNYLEAQEYSLTQSKNELIILEDEYQKYYNSKTEEENHKEIIAEKEIIIKSKTNSTNLFVNEMGYDNVVKMALALTTKYKKEYKKILLKLKNDYNGRVFYNKSILESIKYNGIKKTIRYYQKKLERNKIYKILKMLRKIIMYIPKKLIQFILNS